MTNKWIPEYWNDFVSLLYPRNCVGCGSDILDDDQMICWSCIGQLPLTGFEKNRNNLVEDLFAGRINVQMATGFLFFGKVSLVQHLIHRVKYKGNKELGIILGSMMGRAMKDAGWDDVIDVIVPLPLNKKKALTRGFNQADLLAEGIGEILKKPIEPHVVIRSKFTETQTKKSREKRWENVGDVFDLQDDHSLQKKHILLVDDVVTTGATLEACGQALLKIPGSKLSIGTLAFASGI